MLTEGPRPIETLDQVQAVLTGQASFEELLECARVARIHHEWALVEQATMRALEMTGRRHLAADSVEAAARLLVLVKMQPARGLDELLPRLHLAAEVLRRLAERGHLSISEVLEQVLALQNFIADGSAPSLVSACASLRKLERPDLGIEAADRVLANPEMAGESAPKALTTKGAALLDTGEVRTGIHVLEQAFRLHASSYPAAALARGYLMLSDDETALEWARRASDLGGGRAALSVMAACFRASSDEQGFRAVVEEMQDSPSDEPSPRWPLFVAGRTLYRACRIGEAKAVVADLRRIGENRLAERLEREIRQHELLLARRRERGDT